MPQNKVGATATATSSDTTTMLMDTLRSSHGSGATVTDPRSVTPPRPWRVSARRMYQPGVSTFPPPPAEEPRAPPALLPSGNPGELAETVAEEVVDIALDTTSFPSSVAKVAATVGKSLARSCA